MPLFILNHGKEIWSAFFISLDVRYFVDSFIKENIVRNFCQMRSALLTNNTMKFKYLKIIKRNVFCQNCAAALMA